MLDNRKMVLYSYPAIGDVTVELGCECQSRDSIKMRSSWVADGFESEE
jgi:hypothetical protein